MLAVDTELQQGMRYLWVCIMIFFIADFNDGDKGRTGADKEGFPGGSVGKESACSAGDPGLGRRTPGVRFLGWEDPLEKEMATHSSTLSWKIPWMEEPGRLSSMGLQRVGHD